jgi:dTDP-4-amino-4,6-dideoxygalactose transaminase
MPVAEKACAEVLALPLFPELGEQRLARVVDEVVGYLSRD